MSLRATLPAGAGTSARGECSSRASLSACWPIGREEPVHEQLGGVGMGAIGDDTVGLRHGGNAGLREHEGERRALGLELDVAGVLRAHDDLVLAVDQPAVLLDVGIEGARLDGGEFLEVVVAQDRLQHVPDAVLQAGVRNLDVDRVGPFRIEQVFPRLRCLGGRHVVGVVGDAGHDDRPPGPEALGLALVLGLEGGHLRRDVLAEAATLLEVADHAHIGDLDDIDQVGLGLPLRQDLGVERACLQADVAGLDLGEDLVERGQQLDLTLLGVGRVERERTFRLRLLDVGAGLEALHLAGVVTDLDLGLAPARQPDHQQCRTSDRNEPHGVLHAFLCLRAYRVGRIVQTSHCAEERNRSKPSGSVHRL